MRDAVCRRSGIRLRRESDQQAHTTRHTRKGVSEESRGSTAREGLSNLPRFLTSSTNGSCNSVSFVSIKSPVIATPVERRYEVHSARESKPRTLHTQSQNQRHGADREHGCVRATLVARGLAAFLSRSACLWLPLHEVDSHLAWLESANERAEGGESQRRHEGLENLRTLERQS